MNKGGGGGGGSGSGDDGGGGEKSGRKKRKADKDKRSSKDTPDGSGGEMAIDDVPEEDEIEDDLNTDDEILNASITISSNSNVSTTEKLL